MPVKVGKVTMILFDKQGNATRPREIIAYLAKVDEVPLLLGFNQWIFFSEMRLVCEPRDGVAFVEDDG